MRTKRSSASFHVIVAASALAASLPVACATAVRTIGDGSSGSGGGGGESSSSSSSSASSSSGSGPCVMAADCAAFTDACNVGACINGKCAKQPMNDGVGCDDKKTCTEGDHCQAGVCTGQLKFCPSMDTCHFGTCDVATDQCVQVAGNEGQPCVDQDPCTQTGSCKNGTCMGGQPTDCSFLNGTCSIGKCDPALGCVTTPVNAGFPCDDGFFCTVNDACDANGVCAGVPNTCAAPGDVCMIGSCNEAQNQCTAVPGNNGSACDDKNACTMSETCSNGLCVGGAPTNNGGACDDKNACTTGETCSNGVCGSGAAVVACNNGDGCCPMGCDANNDDDCGGVLYMTSSNGSQGFYAYDVQLNSWTILPDPPTVTYTELTTDGTHVLLLGNNNFIYSFDPATKVWTQGSVGPGPEAASPIGFLKWTPNAFYYVKDGQNTLKYGNGAQGWTTVNLPATGSCAGTYDPASGNLYIREYGNFGVIVFSTQTNTVVKHWPNAMNCGENSRTGAYYNGFFYEREWDQPLYKIDMATGAATNLNITPLEAHTATEVDAQTGDIFIGPYTPTGTTLQVYNVPTNTLKTLAPSPVSVSNHSTIVLVK